MVLRFAPSAARAARERWAGAAEQVGADGSLALTVTVTANEHFFGEVLGWGGTCEVVSPADVREELGRRIGRLQALYG